MANQILQQQAQYLEGRVMDLYTQAQKSPEHYSAICKGQNLRLKRTVVTPLGNGDLADSWPCPSPKREILEALADAVIGSKWEWKIEEDFNGDCMIYITRYIGDDRCRDQEESVPFFGEPHG